MLSIVSAPLLLAVAARLIPQIVASPLVAEIDISVESSDLNNQHAPNLLLYPLPNLRGRPFELYADHMRCVDIPIDVAQNVYSMSIVDPVSCVFFPEKHCKLPWDYMDQLEKVHQGDHQEVSDNVRAAKSVLCGEDYSMGFNTQKNMAHHKGSHSLQLKLGDKEMNNQHSIANHRQLFAENRPNGQPNGTQVPLLSHAIHPIH
ncbi:hypothetical protein DL95DRAFT_414920 [Leptodontidium sp. 2 PMI_412]|nr:hypothetical protein DL95DRAFT_414920 [Leptodontidium sp. 2 PMI_412]